MPTADRVLLRYGTSTDRDLQPGIDMIPAFIKTSFFLKRPLTEESGTGSVLDSGQIGTGRGSVPSFIYPLHFATLMVLQPGPGPTGTRLQKHRAIIFRTGNHVATSALTAGNARTCGIGSGAPRTIRKAPFEEESSRGGCGCNSHSDSYSSSPADSSSPTLLDLSNAAKTAASCERWRRGGLVGRA